MCKKIVVIDGIVYEVYKIEVTDKEVVLYEGWNTTLILHNSSEEECLAYNMQNRTCSMEFDQIETIFITNKNE